MNDFTKEELLDLYCIAEEFAHTKGLPITTPERAIQLQFKIQSMIDNYCEHEIEVTPNESGHGHNWGNKCKKCGKPFKGGVK